MQGFWDKLEQIGGRLQQVMFLNVIKESFTDMMPIIITGSMGSLINNVICSTSNGLAQFDGFGWLAQFAPIFSAINYAAMNFLAIYLVFRIGHKFAQVKGGNTIVSGFVALCSYLTLIPTVASKAAAESGEMVNISNVVASNYTNSQGMFMSIIVGYLSAMMFCRLVESGKLNLKMPESVPAGVANSFKVLFPAMATVFTVSILGFVFKLLTGMYVPDFITKTLQAPMNAIMQHPAGVIVLTLLCQLFWCIGIHGSSMVSPVRNTIGLAAIAANLEAVNAGLRATNVFTYTFWNTFCTIGGCGNTIGLIIAILLFSKREDNRAIAKLSLVPGIFGINEPMIFGMPIVLNPILMIPFIIAPMVTAAVGYFFTAIGFAAPAYVTVPFTVPFLLNAFITTGSFGTVIIQALCIVISTLIYIPFVKMLNKQEG